jgi:crossover junction endodeoxyribonuclease RuvC
MNFLGIDPGPKSGGLAIVTNQKEIFKLTVMPPTERDLYEFLHQYDHTITMAWIEKVHAFPKQGVSSAFNFGDNFGLLKGMVTACEIPYELVQPRFWQKRLQIPPKKKEETKPQWKNRLKGIAQQLYPGVPILKDHADAVLIAEACRREYGLKIAGK